MDNESAQNNRRGKAVAICGIALNFLLALVKILAGSLCMLVSVAADGINNLTDCGSGVVSLISMHVSQKPPDKEHPFGHQRMEYIASLIVGFLVLALAAELVRSSIESLIGGNAALGSFWLYLVLGASVVVKLFMFFLYRWAGKSCNSDVLKASSKDSVSDCVATLAVIVGLALAEAFSVPAIDGFLGIAVALFIIWEGISIVREESSKLLGRAADPALTQKIKQALLTSDKVLGLHDLRVYSYGNDKFFATVHIEMDASLSPVYAHEVIDGLERGVMQELGVDLTAHFDPVDLNDGEARELEERVLSSVEGMVEGMSLHDFRIVRGAKTKVLFEASVPFSCAKTNAEIENDLERVVRVLGDYDVSVFVERE